MRKTARQRLAVRNDLLKIKPAPAVWGGGDMVIPHPSEVDAVVRKIPKGKLVTLDELRDFLARKHGADI